jgi:hypothetical protein
MAFSLEFEKVLQVINPSIALPYWVSAAGATVTTDVHDETTQDFVQDVEVYGNAFVENAIVFDDDWFGVGSPDNVRMEFMYACFCTHSLRIARPQYHKWTMGVCIVRECQ